MVTLVSIVQPRKASVSIVIRLAGNTISVSDVQLAKAPISIYFTLSGMVILVSNVLSANARYPILVTGLPSISAGITNDVSLPQYLVIFTVPSSCISVRRQVSSVKPFSKAYLCPAVFLV